MSRLLTSEEARHFKDTIAAYAPNDAALDLFRDSKFAVIAGPAGAGKDTLRNNLAQQFPEAYLPILSTTTRPSREGEIDGQTYHFRTIPAFNKLLMNREFLQVALVHNQQLAGLHISEIHKLNPRQHGLSILIVQTENELRVRKPDLKTIFIIPPNHRTLIKRINAERMLDESEIARRLRAAKTEIAWALESPRYYCLISNTVQHITSLAYAYLQEDAWDQNEDSRARRAMCEILNLLDD